MSVSAPCVSWVPNLPTQKAFPSNCVKRPLLPFAAGCCSKVLAITLGLPPGRLSSDDDDDLYLSLQKQQPVQRYIPIGYFCYRSASEALPKPIKANEPSPSKFSNRTWVHRTMGKGLPRHWQHNLGRSHKRTGCPKRRKDKLLHGCALKGYTPPGTHPHIGDDYTARALLQPHL